MTSRADQDLWIRKSDHHEEYDYLATHVDDIVVAAKKPGGYIAQIEQEFGLRNIQDSPKFYLRCNITSRKKGFILHAKHILMKH